MFLKKSFNVQLIASATIIIIIVGLLITYKKSSIFIEKDQVILQKKYVTDKTQSEVPQGYFSDTIHIKFKKDIDVNFPLSAIPTNLRGSIEHI